MQPAASARDKPTASERKPLLRARGLVKAFGGLLAVDDMSISLGQGEMLGLIGPNGAGKTTLFNLLAGSLKPTAGSIDMAGRDLTRAGPERRIASGIGAPFRSHGLSLR